MKEVAGDILLTKAEALEHGVAPNDDFANVLALALRERWPAMYKDFRHYSQTFTLKTGELWTCSAVCGSACPAAPQTGTGAIKKGASPQLYVEGLNGETARHNHVSALAAEAS